ncbi:protein CTLA-2-beta-like [Hermetia illucens]|uniref:protein CTLA-2-beta-like n=1 Tax=Hermetia illucens TaxID=343691 RepID=UPI0018CC21BE|nr:protein CTLA-2-beta-like [Hermetia illucens]
MASQQTNVSDSEWEDYKSKFNKSYKDAADEQQHREIYVATKAKIAEHNAKYEAGQVTYSMGINHFADLTEEERGRYLGCRVPESK